jgi:hypothetical protein
VRGEKNAKNERSERALRRRKIKEAKLWRDLED